MKIKVINQNRVINQTSGKDISSLSQWHKLYEDVSLPEGELDNSLETIGSNLKILSGSFSQIKPIECETNNPGPSGLNPIATSTPIIENGNGSDVGETNFFEDVTFNFEQDVVNQKNSYRKYVEDMSQFVMKTQSVVEEKMRKRSELLKKICKYQNKIRKMEKSLKRINNIIVFGGELPKLCEEYFKDE